MSKSKKQKYKPRPWETITEQDRYVRLFATQLDSEAMRSLSHSAFRLYVVLKSEYRGDFTGDSVMPTYDKLHEKTGFAPATISKAISELETKGFIKTERGTLQCSDTQLKRQPNKYTFVSEWKKPTTQK